MSSLRLNSPVWKLLFCYSISIACLIWVLHGYPLNELIPNLRTLDWRWMLVAIVAELSVYVCHGWRWTMLLSPVARLSLWRTVQSVYIGLFANEVLPLRVGEVLRCYLLAHWNGLRISLVFASAAMERLIDGAWMLIAFMITASYVKRIPEEMTILVQVMGVLVLIGAAGLLWVVRHHADAHAAIRESKWASALRHIVEGLHLMGNARTLGFTALLSLLYLALQYFTIYALMRAYRLDFSILVAAGVLTIVRLATVVPNAPGNVGLVNAACVMALQLFDVEKNDATTFSFIFWGATTIPLLIGGAIATGFTGSSIGELRNRAKIGLDTAKG